MTRARYNVSVGVAKPFGRRPDRTDAVPVESDRIEPTDLLEADRKPHTVGNPPRPSVEAPLHVLDHRKLG